MPHPRTRLRALVVAAMAIAITASMTTAAHAAPSASELTKKIDDGVGPARGRHRVVQQAAHRPDKTTDEQKAAGGVAGAGQGQAGRRHRAGRARSPPRPTSRAGSARSARCSAAGGQDSLMDRMSLPRPDHPVQPARHRRLHRDHADLRRPAGRAQGHSGQADGAAQGAGRPARRRSRRTSRSSCACVPPRTAARPTSASSGAAGKAPTISGSAGVAVDYAYAAANKPAYYGYGDAGPSTYDCSGLTMAAWKAAGKSLPHNAAAQYSATARISRSQLKPGDLVFYRSLGHVGLYVGSGMIIDASRAGRAGEEAHDRHHDAVRLRPGQPDPVPRCTRKGRYPSGYRPFRRLSERGGIGRVRRPAGPRPGPAHAAGRAPGSPAGGSARG